MCRHWMVWWAVIGAAVACCALPGEALAESLTVTSSSDASFSSPPGGTTFCATPQPSGTTCTLRAAIQELNALGGGPHTITLPARTYTLTQTGDDDTAVNGDLDVTANITINGGGAATTIVQACNVGANPDCTGIDRLFDVRPGGTLTMSGVTVRKGSTSGNGGGIQNRGTLVLRNVVLDANGAAGEGGGLEHIGSAATLTNVSVTNNQATFGAGIDTLSTGLSLTNVTVAGNRAGNTGGGLNQGGLGSPSATLTNVTVSGNSALASGGGITANAGTLTLRNTIVANNLLTGGGTSNCGGSVTLSSQGYNLVFPGAGCSLNAIGDQIDKDPILGLLQANGGQVPTQALLPGSFAIEGGNPLTPLDGQGGRCAAADARGLARPADGNLNGSGRCDIGAYELASFTVNATVDADDASPGNLACATSTPGQCTLRAAVREANALGGAAIGLPANHYTLTRSGDDDTAQNGDLDVGGGIIIQGAGPANTIIQACDADANPTCPGVDRLFDVRPNGSLTMSGVTVRNGTTGGAGGGVRVAGDLSLANVVVDGNVANLGGGIDALSGPTLSLFDVTISRNRAIVAGGGISSGSDALSLTNVTISGNIVNSAFGGGLDLSAAVSVATLANVTIAGNISAGGSAGIEGVTGSSVVLRNSIIANNPPTPGASSNCGGTGTFASQGFNLVFPGSGCGFTQATDKQNQDPNLGPLANNGGSTPTMALLAGSAAIDTGNTATPGTGGTSCSGVDQRGIVRLQDGDLDGTPRCDMGAFEARLIDLCAQRPPVQLVATLNGQGGLTATVTRGLGAITEIRFHDAPTSHVANPNAIIQFSGGGTGQGDFITTPPPGTTTFRFTVLPVDVNRPTTVPLDVVDACGAWSTLVGGGAGAIGRVGTFTVAGLGTSVAVGQTASAQFAWTLPVPRHWRELSSLELRLTDAEGVAWGVRWTETGDAFTVTDTRTPGLFKLASPRTQGSGPTGPSVTLTLPLEVLPAAAGRTFTVEVRATDATGTVQGFEPAGTLAVLGAAAGPPADTPSAETRDEERQPKPTERQRWQQAHTNAGSQEDTRVEGNVVAVDLDAHPPTITIADRDGLVVLRLHGDAAGVTVKVGDYVTAGGEKVTEQLYEIDDIAR